TALVFVIRRLVCTGRRDGSGRILASSLRACKRSSRRPLLSGRHGEGAAKEASKRASGALIALRSRMAQAAKNERRSRQAMRRGTAPKPAPPKATKQGGVAARGNLRDNRLRFLATLA